MKYLSVTNAHFADLTHTSIIMDVEFEGMGVVPFTATPDDVEEHGRKLYTEAIAGKFGGIVAFVPAVPTQQEIELAESSVALSELASIDRLSVRLIRAHLTGDPTALVELSKLETKAIQQRKKVKK